MKQFLHNLTHYDYYLNKIPNVFIIPSSYNDLYSINYKHKYFESIQMFFLIPIVLYSFFILLLLIYKLINYLFCNNKQVRKNNKTNNKLNKKQNKKCNINGIRLMLLIFTIIFIITQFYQTHKFNNSLITAESNFNNVYQLYNNAIVYGNDLGIFYYFSYYLNK